MTLFNPISEAQFLVNFSKFGNFLFTEKSGGDIEADTSEYANGSGMEIYKLTGPRKVSNIILKAPYDPGLMAYLDPVIAAWSCTPGTITITPVDCQGKVNTSPGGSPIVINGLSGVTPAKVGDAYIYEGARIAKYTPPKVDRKSANAAMFELDFVVNRMTRAGTYNPGTVANTPNNATLKAAEDFLKSTVLIPGLG